MAERRPLVLISGTPAELPAGDALPGDPVELPFIEADGTESPIPLGISGLTPAFVDEAQDWTAIQAFTAGLTGGADSTTPSANVTITLDGKGKQIAPDAAITISFSIPNGATFASAPIVIKQGATARAITWSGITLLGTAPTMAANKSYLFGAFTMDGGTTIYLQVGQAQA